MASTDTVNCEVIHDGSTVTVTSPRGGQVKVDVAKLRAADFKLYHKLTRQGPMHEAQVALTKGEMGVFMNINGARAVTNGTKNAEAVASKPVALSQEAARAESATLNRTEEGANKKVTGYGRTEEERAINRAQNAVDNLEGAKGNFWEFSYDIPVAKDENGDNYSVLPNPSWELWRMGCIRRLLSVWFMPAHIKDSKAFNELLGRWNEFNGTKQAETTPVEYELFQMHPDECQHVRIIAREKLRKEIIKVHTSLIERLDAASKRFEAADAELNRRLLEEGKEVTPAQYERILKLRTVAESGSINDAKRHCDCCIAAARSFDETGAVVDLIKALHAAIKFNEASIKARNELSEVE